MVDGVLHGFLVGLAAAVLKAFGEDIEGQARAVGLEGDHAEVAAFLPTAGLDGT